MLSLIMCVNTYACEAGVYHDICMEDGEQLPGVGSLLFTVDLWPL